MAKWLLAVPRSFTELMQRLGCAVPIGANVGLDLTGNIVPVAIVDPDPLTVVASTPALDTPVTTGEQIAPVVGTVIADTGAIVAGTYNFTIILGVDQGAAIVRLQRRDAPNAANIWGQVIGVNGTAGPPSTLISMRAVIGAGERLRIITMSGPGAGNTVQASIWISS